MNKDEIDEAMTKHMLFHSEARKMFGDMRMKSAKKQLVDYLQSDGLRVAHDFRLELGRRVQRGDMFIQDWLCGNYNSYQPADK